MGYAHYWKNQTRFTDEQWRDLCGSARGIFAVARAKDIQVVNGMGEEGTEPTIYETEGPAATEDVISFNGVPDHETCHLSRGESSFDFCKTAYKPYDAVVVAVLIEAAHINPGFSWSSDGEGEAGYMDGGKALLEAYRGKAAEEHTLKITTDSLERMQDVIDVLRRAEENGLIAYSSEAASV